jgi:hypothetical protein
MDWLKRLLYIGLFSFGLWSGAVTGRLFFEGREDYEEAVVIASKPERVELEIHRTMFILVESVENPMGRLMGVWLFVHDQMGSNYFLTPLYPSRLETYRHPHSPQLVDLHALTLVEQIPVIQVQSIPAWQSTIILDEVSLGLLIDAIENPTAGGAGLRWAQGLPRSWENPAEALVEQEKLIRYLLENLKTISNRDRINQITELILTSGHLISDQEMAGLRLGAESLDMNDMEVTFPLLELSQDHSP